MKKAIIVLSIILLICLGGLYYVKNYMDKDIKIIDKIKVEKKLNIIDEESDSRCIAVMINNNHNAWPHSGLNDSIINYELLAEGGITRIMAIYKDSDVDKIGSVRSSRPYFLDYALENDAIYIHWGASEEAYSDIKSLNMDSLDGITYEGKYFYRDSSHNKIYEHTGFTKMSMIENGINAKNYRTTTAKDNLFNYSVSDIEVTDKMNAITADKVTINYSSYHNTSYIYDSESKLYKRYMSDTAHIDGDTNLQYTAKNIIVYKLQYISIDSYGRLKLDNIGSGEGYYITNGKAFPITWEKDSRSSQTVYKYKYTKEEIVLNDGNTWIQIMPKDKELYIESNEE